MVVGASRGIGEAIARRLVADGARVMFASRNPEALRAVARDVDPTGKRSSVVEMDIRDSGSVERAVAATVTAFGGLEIAVNNAGVLIPPSSFMDLDEARFDELMSVNLRGVFLSMKYELRVMQASGGAILNIGSTASLVAMPMIAAYVASKHAIVGLTKSAALEFADRGVRVNALAVGTTETETFRAGPGSNPQGLAALMARVPMGRLASPHEIAAVATFLCSDAASYMTGLVVPVDGGYVAP